MPSVEPGRSFLYQACAGNPSQDCIAERVQVVTGLNRHFAKATGVSQFFTMIYGILDRDTAEFRYVSAGHFSPVHFRCGIAQPVQEAGGIPVGLFPGATYEQHSISLSKGCTSVRMAFRRRKIRADEQFGVDRVLEILTRNRDLLLEETVSSLMQCVWEWTAPGSPADDASLLAIERSA